MDRQDLYHTTWLPNNTSTALCICDLSTYHDEIRTCIELSNLLEFALNQLFRGKRYRLTWQSGIYRPCICVQSLRTTWIVLRQIPVYIESDTIQFVGLIRLGFYDFFRSFWRTLVLGLERVWGRRLRGQIRRTPPLDISLWELCQNPIILEPENFMFNIILWFSRSKMIGF